MKLSIRKARASDSIKIFRWRSSEEAVKNSFSPGPSSYEAHNEWFKKQLQNPQSHMYIGQVGSFKQEIGVIRFDISEEHNCKVSITIDPAWRGKRLSSPLIDAGIARISRRFDVIFLAEIKKKNLASRKCFENCGFTLYNIKANKLLYVNKQVLIDKIESVRTRNNVNWMNLMRLAFKVAPHEAEQIFEQINQDDNSIAALLQILTTKVSS